MTRRKLNKDEKENEYTADEIFRYLKNHEYSFALYKGEFYSSITMSHSLC